MYHYQSYEINKQTGFPPHTAGFIFKGLSCTSLLWDVKFQSFIHAVKKALNPKTLWSISVPGPHSVSGGIHMVGCTEPEQWTQDYWGNNCFSQLLKGWLLSLVSYTEVCVTYTSSSSISYQPRNATLFWPFFIFPLSIFSPYISFFYYETKSQAAFSPPTRSNSTLDEGSLFSPFSFLSVPPPTPFSGSYGHQSRALPFLWCQYDWFPYPKCG